MESIFLVILRFIEAIVSLFTAKTKVDGVSVPAPKPSEPELEKRIATTPPEPIKPIGVVKPPPTVEQIAAKVQHEKMSKIVNDRTTSSEEKIKQILAARTGKQQVTKPMVLDETFVLSWIVCHERKAQGASFAIQVKDDKENLFRPTEYIFFTLVAEEAKKLVENETEFKNVKLNIIKRDGWGIEGAYLRAKALKSNYIIEPHYNAFNSKVRGTETLVANEPQDIALGQVIHDDLCLLFQRGGSSRGLKIFKPEENGGRNLYQSPTLPNCLPEAFFGDNLEDAAFAWSSKRAMAMTLLRSHIKFHKSLKPIIKG